MYHRFSTVCPTRNPSRILSICFPWHLQSGREKEGSVYMIAFPSENLSALDWTFDQWPVQYVRGIDVILLKFFNLYSTEVQSLLLYRQSSPVNKNLKIPTI